jgi:hypothetical protein
MALMPQYAPLVVLLFLGTALAALLAAAALAYGAARKQTVVLRWAVIGAAALVGGYATLLFGASLASRDRVLGSGEKKYFCEIDCHLGYSVERVAKSRTLGAPPGGTSAAGTFYIVSLKTWFDESTISPHRPKDATLYPNPRQVYVVDAAGHRYEPSPAGQRAIEVMGWASTPLSRPLIPGESYVTELVFDLPSNIREPRLYVGAADPVCSFLIGHEESPLHRKIWFRV